jgi:hypothetical protein
MIRIDFLIYTAVFWVLAIFAIAIAQSPTPDHLRGCIASAYQAEMRGFDLQENLKACQ